MADPMRAAWTAVGKPAAVVVDTDGQCARCGAAGPASGWRKVLSGNFLDWDKLPWRASGVFCPACAWAFNHKPLRQRPHLIAPGVFCELDPVALGCRLAAPIDQATLVTVPVAWKKHIAPYAQYGVVATDHEQLTWTAVDCELLDVLARLRRHGFGEAALAEPAPRWPILRKLEPDRQRHVLTLWPRLDPWRARPSYLQVACRATRTPKETST